MLTSRIIVSATLGAALVGALALAPQPAAARVVVGVGVGVPLYAPYYPPPPVYYAPPAYYAPPPVVYTQPPGPAYVSPPTTQAPPAAAAPMAGNCREYTSQTMIGGQPQQTVGTACQQPDGTWRIQN